MSMLDGKVVMVTGAGGSIGRGLVKAILDTATVARLVLVDLCEYNLYEVDKIVKSHPDAFTVELLIADISDNRLISQVVAEHRPEYVYHAAALKHVPMLESTHNSLAAINTNVLGTRNLLSACYNVGGVSRFVLVSTDKAVNPTSMMGATKAIAEGLVREYEQRGLPGTIVRFGNVLGSSGSVVPLFESQIARGGPVTVTDEKMYRYLMTIPAAVSLVLKASYRPPGTYVLEMGDPVNIAELARYMILASGKDIDINIIGLRPGEKLVEEFKSEQETGVWVTKDLQRIDCPETVIKYGGLAVVLATCCKNRNLELAINHMKDAVNWTTELTGAL